MVKRHTTLSIEDDLIKKAKEKFINISKLTEDAIRKRLGEVEVIIDTNIENCEICGLEMKKATIDDLNGIRWMLPYEKWMCPRCLKEEIQKLI